jgi:hypothetical protein
VIVLDYSQEPDDERRRRLIAEDVARLKEQVAQSVAEHRLRQAVEAERARLERERRQEAREASKTVAGICGVLLLALFALAAVLNALGVQL